MSAVHPNGVSSSFRQNLQKGIPLEATRCESRVRYTSESGILCRGLPPDGVGDRSGYSVVVEKRIQVQCGAVPLEGIQRRDPYNSGLECGQYSAPSLPPNYGETSAQDSPGRHLRSSRALRTRYLPAIRREQDGRLPADRFLWS